MVQIEECVEMKSSLRLLISGIRRLTLDGGNVERNLKIENHENRIFWGDVTNVKEKLLINEQTKALSAEIIQSCRDLIQINQLYREAVHQILSQAKGAKFGHFRLKIRS